MTDTRPTISRSGAVSVGVGSLLSGVSGYVALLLAARLLTPADNATFLAFWSFLFFWFGILTGLSLETTRAVFEADRLDHRASGTRVVIVALVIGALLAVVILASSPAWASAILGRGRELLAVIVAIAVVLWSGHSAVVGILAGRRRWTTQALVTGGDGVLRVGMVATAGAIASTVVGFAAAAGLGTLAWLLLTVGTRRVREVVGTRIDEAPSRFVANSATAMLAAAASSAIVVGFPVLLRLTSSDADYLASAPLILSIALTRAPLLVPLNAYQSVVITHFLARREQAARALLPIAGAILGVGVVGAALAWLIGPWLLEVIISPTYHVPGWVLASLTFAAALLALLSLTGALTLAVRRHAPYAAGWIVATVVCVLVLLVPGEIEWRTVASLVVGPLVGAGVHLVGILRATRVVAS